MVGGLLIEPSPTMSSSQFKFQRLPTTAELNSLPAHSTYHGFSLSEEDPAIRSSGVFDNDFLPLSGIPGLPRRPVRNTSSPAYRAIVFMGHSILTLSPIIFLLLAFTALSVNGDPLSSKGNVVLEASKLGPSLFPIIFAAVVGRLMKTTALWLVQRGSTIGMLEHLNGSQNLLAAIERAFHLRGLGGWSALIILLWALSPIGGQSSLRVLKIGRKANLYTSPLSYFDTHNSSETAFTGASYLAYFWPTVSAIFQACLLAPDKITLSSSDLWGNVKIPLMHTLPSYTNSTSQDWLVVPQDNKTIFTSLSGIPVIDLKEATTTNFTAESTYFNLTCSNSMVFTNGEDDTGSAVESFRNWTGPLLVHNNVSAAPFYDSNRGWSSFMIDTTWNASVNGYNSSMDLIYASQNVTGSYELTAYKCSLGYTRVESLLNCDGLNCYVSKMRPSRNNTISTVVTPWNSLSIVPLYNFILNFPFAAGAQHSAVTSPIDFYIAGSNNPFGSALGYESSVYTNVTGEQVAQRLGILINTLWQASNARTGLFDMGRSMPMLNTTSNVTTNIDVYVADMFWIWMTICISFILVGCGITGFAFKYTCKIPDLLGYVSTLAKDNPYFHEHVGDDRLDGMDRARLLQNVVVQITNVRPSDERGHIALKSIPESEDPAQSRINNSRRRKGYI